MTLLAIAAIGADRPGIVAGVTQVLFERGCNLEDTSMTILRGHFAMTLLVAGDVSATDLEDALAPVAAQLELLLTVSEVRPEHEQAHVRPFVVSVYGADHPGIVARVTALLAGRGVNITDLTTRLVDSPAPLYAMVLEVELPASCDDEGLARDLATLAAELEVDASLRAADPDIL
jgi:glycine cleavage system transcriptional repressor